MNEIMKELFMWVVVALDVLVAIPWAIRKQEEMQRKNKMWERRYHSRVKVEYEE